MHSALHSHPGTRQVGKVGRLAQWSLLPDEEWLKEKQPASKKPRPTATPLLGKNARSPN